MPSNRRTGVLALAASLALAAGAVTAVLPASAVDEPIAYQPAGALSLTTSTTGTGQVEYEGIVQPLTKIGSCELSTGSDLLRFEGLLGSDPTPKLGFNSGSIGVIETGAAGFCNRVDAVSLRSKSETLVLTLGSELTNFAAKPLVARSASLDLEVKSAPFWLGGTKARIEIKTYLGAEPVGALEVTQGSPTCPAKDGDNCQVLIPETADKYFDRVTLKAVKGSFSLEGGSDPLTSTQVTKPAATTFELFSEVDAVFSCESSDPLEVGNANVEYLGNADPDDLCEDFGVTLESGDTQVRFLKPLDISPTAQFVFEINWTLEPEPGSTWSPGVTLPPAYIDFELPGGEGEKLMPFCPAYLFDDAGDLVGVTDLTSEADRADLSSRDMETLDVPGAAETQFACIGSRHVDARDEFIVSDMIYLIGDAKMRL